MNRKQRRHGKPQGTTYSEILARKQKLWSACQQAANDTTVQLQTDIQVQRAMWLMCVAMNGALKSARCLVTPPPDLSCIGSAVPPGRRHPAEGWKSSNLNGRRKSYEPQYAEFNPANGTRGHHGKVKPSGECRKPAGGRPAQSQSKYALILG